METTAPIKHRKHLALAILIACSAAAVAGNQSVSTSTPWPVASSLPRAEGKPTLLLFVYPGDTDSEAVLANALATARSRPFVAIVHVADAHPVTDGELGAAHLRDNGVEAGRFGVAKTGHVVLCDADGRLQYSGSVAHVVLP